MGTILYYSGARQTENSLRKINNSSQSLREWTQYAMETKQFHLPDHLMSAIQPTG